MVATVPPMISWFKNLPSQATAPPDAHIVGGGSCTVALRAVDGTRLDASRLNLYTSEKGICIRPVDAIALLAVNAPDTFMFTPFTSATKRACDVRQSGSPRWCPLPAAASTHQYPVLRNLLPYTAEQCGRACTWGCSARCRPRVRVRQYRLPGCAVPSASAVKSSLSLTPPSVVVVAAGGCSVRRRRAKGQHQFSAFAALHPSGSHRFPFSTAPTVVRSQRVFFPVPPCVGRMPVMFSSAGCPLVRMVFVLPSPKVSVRVRSVSEMFFT